MNNSSNNGLILFLVLILIWIIAICYCVYHFYRDGNIVYNEVLELTNDIVKAKIARNRAIAPYQTWMFILGFSGFTMPTLGSIFMGK